MKIGILGMGEIGEANFEFLSSKRGYEIETYDPKDNNTFEMNKCDAYIICPSSDNVIEAALLVKEIDAAPLLCIESTTKIGTCRKIHTLFEGYAHVVHCPQRYWLRDPQKRGVVRDRLISAVTIEALKAGMNFYQGLQMPVRVVVPIECAEFAKYAENAYRGVQIAFAQELKEYTDELGIDFNEVRAAIMTATPQHWIAEVRDGIKGHCVPMAMDWLSGMSIVDAANKANKRFIDENS
jgi:UDP-N-acetyl-D-glucosamine dehydrogenase